MDYYVRGWCHLQSYSYGKGTTILVSYSSYMVFTENAHIEVPHPCCSATTALLSDSCSFVLYEYFRLEQHYYY